MRSKVLGFQLYGSYGLGELNITCRSLIPLISSTAKYTVTDATIIPVKVNTRVDACIENQSVADGVSSAMIRLIVTVAIIAFAIMRRVVGLTLITPSFRKRR